MLASWKRNPVLKFFHFFRVIQRKMSHSRSVGWLFVFWILSMCASCDFQGCKTAASIGGFRFPGHTISTHSEPSIWSCFRSCKLKMPLKCHSINYNLETFQCEINNRTKNGKPHDFVYRSEYVYLENPFRGKNLQEQFIIIMSVFPTTIFWFLYPYRYRYPYRLKIKTRHNQDCIETFTITNLF